ncbi:hypothetical protein F5888DRAFT_1858903 [Russula emetica]|nr:hypothetical protein F5888DRAFT_1858903 [Russula emetica]
MDTDTPSRVTRTEQGRDDGAIFVSNFFLTTQEELLEALEPFGKYESRFKIRVFIYSDKERGRTLPIERAEDRPYNLSPGSTGHPLELGKPLDPTTFSDILKELTRTVPRFGGCSQVLKRHRVRRRLLDFDFVPWVFYIGPAYRVVYISGWAASDGRPALLQWTYDILPRQLTAISRRKALKSSQTIHDARAALRMLDGRVEPDSETLHVGLSRPPAEHSNQMRRWIYEAEDMEKSGGGEGREACLEDGWGGLGFGSGEEEQDDAQGVEQ